MMAMFSFPLDALGRGVEHVERDLVLKAAAAAAGMGGGGVDGMGGKRYDKLAYFFFAARACVLLFEYIVMHRAFPVVCLEVC
mmetsp:Transcript_34701/g.48438  ORF Transcript_34701/g.48438 Transcript_34701/m.48438 type:complete len:82 (-) Transcript_34701:203-448(-)